MKNNLIQDLKKNGWKDGVHTICSRSSRNELCVVNDARTSTQHTTTRNTIMLISLSPGLFRIHFGNNLLSIHLLSYNAHIRIIWKGGTIMSNSWKTFLVEGTGAGCGTGRGSFLPWWSDMLLHSPSVTEMERWMGGPDGGI